MSPSMVLCDNLVFCNGTADRILLHSHNSSSCLAQLSCRRRKFLGLVPKAKKSHSKKKKSWWQKFFFDDDGNWLGLKDEDMLVDGVESEGGSSDEELTDDEKFEAWRRRAEAIIELREAQEDVRNEENRRWEDWIMEEKGDYRNGSSWVDYSNSTIGKAGDDTIKDISEMTPGRGFVESVRDIILGREEDEMLYEDRVFRYASFKSAKFLAVLVLIPWALDFLVHDYVLLPYLDRYVKTVPIAAQMLDVRRSQKLEMVKELKLQQARYRLEVDIGKSPHLSDEELWLELHNKGLELQDERRLENRKAFANIWSDLVFGISLFILLCFNQNKVALLKFTGYKIINNISDTGKAFLIILVTDIFLGYHSESGWQTLCEVIIEHYGLEVDQAFITIFICFVPVIMDACVKLWMFKFLPRLSPKVANIFKEMKRH